MKLDETRIKLDLIARWRKGGTDALVKVIAADVTPDPARPIGYCTEVKFLTGRTPAEIERAIGLRTDSKLIRGAIVYLVKPLPSPAEFHFRGYSQTPAGIPTTIKPAHPDYPPGLGVPQWELTASQANLIQFAQIAPGHPFRYRASNIGQIA